MSKPKCGKTLPNNINCYCYYSNVFLPIKVIEGWVYNSVVENLLSMCKAFRSTISTIKNNNNGLFCRTCETVKRKLKSIISSLLMDKLCELAVTSLALSLCVCICAFCLYRFRIGSHDTESLMPTVFDTIQ